MKRWVGGNCVCVSRKSQKVLHWVFRVERTDQLGMAKKDNEFDCHIDFSINGLITGG